MKLLDGLGAALCWLTVVPVRRVASSDPVPWFPWIGALLGALGTAVGVGVRSLAPGEIGALLAGTLVVASWAAMTGFLHLDGLADSADALIGVRARDERLRIMRDSRIGSYGAAALVLTIVASVAAAASVIEQARFSMIAFAPVVARWSATLSLSSLPAARPDGLAHTLVRRRPVSSSVVASVPVIAAAALAAPMSPVPVAIGVVAALAVPRVLARRVGGVTGDTVGAGIVLVECAVLLAGALASG